LKQDFEMLTPSRLSSQVLLHVKGSAFR